MKKLTLILLASILLITGCTKDSSTGNKALDGELKLESNQSLMIAQVTAIYGNEITLALAKEEDQSEMKQQSQEQESETSAQSTESNQQSENNQQSDNDATSKEQSSKEMPSGEQPSGEKPSGQNPPSGDKQEASGDTTNKEGNSQETDKEAKTQMTRYTLTGEEMTTTILVGTPVTTLLGTVTTFSRIAVDNTLKIVTEKNEAGEDVIVAIYIVG